MKFVGRRLEERYESGVHFYTSCAHSEVSVSLCTEFIKSSAPQLRLDLTHQSRAAQPEPAVCLVTERTHCCVAGCGGHLSEVSTNYIAFPCSIALIYFAGHQLSLKA